MDMVNLFLTARTGIHFLNKMIHNIVTTNIEESLDILNQ